MKIIISIDPGKTNLAWTIISQKGRLKNKGLVTTTYTSLSSTSEGRGKNKIVTTASVHVKRGIRIISRLINRLNEKTANMEVIFVYERFVPRGRFNRGNLTEIINMIIGQLISGIKCTKIIPLMAATWKRRAKERYGYTDNFNKTLPQHIVDAYTMGLYYLDVNNKLTPERIKKILTTLRKKDYDWSYSNKHGWVKPNKAL